MPKPTSRECAPFYGADAEPRPQSARFEAQKPSDTETPWRSGDTTGETARRRFDGAVR